MFQTDLTPASDEDTSWTQVYFDLDAAADLQESQFFALAPSDVDPARYFPINTFFDVKGYRQATDKLTDERKERIDSVQSTFKEAMLPIQLIETDDRAKVAIVFERVNRLGIELDTLQLLSAWTWSEDFDLQERFQDLSDELKPFGFGGVGEDTNLLLRSCAAIVAGKVSSDALVNLNGAEVRSRFDEIENGLRGAIDFACSHISIRKMENLPYPAMLVPLAVFFAAANGVSVALEDHQREEILRWFWRSCISRRFSSGVLRNLTRDVSEIMRLRTEGESSLSVIPCTISSDWFHENEFKISAANTKTFILMLTQEGPLSFVSGSPVDLKAVLQSYNRSEFHHLFPRAYLTARGVGRGRINQLSNFAFINSIDNKKLGGNAPSVYRSRMPSNLVDDILDRALCPETLFTDDFAATMDERSSRLAELARKLADL